MLLEVSRVLDRDCTPSSQNRWHGGNVSLNVAQRLDALLRVYDCQVPSEMSPRLLTINFIFHCFLLFWSKRPRKGAKCTEYLPVQSK